MAVAKIELTVEEYESLQRRLGRAFEETRFWHQRYVNLASRWLESGSPQIEKTANPERVRVDGDA